MEIEFDADKDAINRFKHRLAFGKRVLEAEDCIVVETFQIGDEEERLKGIGMIDGKLSPSSMSGGKQRFE